MRTARRSKQQWRDLVAEFEAGGLTQQAFARRKRVNLGSLRNWIYKFRKEQVVPGFVEVVRGPRPDAWSHPSVALSVGRVRVEFTENPSAGYLAEFVSGINGADQ